MELVFVELPGRAHTVLEGLNRLRLSNELCDVVLCCGGREFPCHRAVLASLSSYFEAMFTTDMLESRQERVNLNGVEPHILDFLLTFVYTSKAYVPKEHLQDLVSAAHMLDIKSVQEVCCRYMDRNIDKNNCLGMHSFAEALSFVALEEHSLDFIIKHFKNVYMQELYPSLSLDKVTKILSNDDLNVPKEEMTFEAAMLWFNKCPTRRQHFEKVLELIRLPLISPSYVHNVIEALEVVKESPCCQRLISEAKAKNQHLLPYSKTVHPRRTTEVIVIVGGETEYETETHVECFDPVTKKGKVMSSEWKSLASLPFAVGWHGVAVSGTTLYVAGGKHPTGKSSRELWRYDPSNDDSWMKMAPMDKPRFALGLVMLDGYLWAVGGHGSPECLVERYDPHSNTWELMESDSVDRPGPSNSCVVTLDGLIYYIEDTVGEEMGRPADMAGVVLGLYKYNTKTSVWTRLAPTQVARSRVAACALNGKIYVIGNIPLRKGMRRSKRLMAFSSILDTLRDYNIIVLPYKGSGEHSSVTMDRVECYDPTTNRWTLRASMNTARCNPGVAVMNGKIYALGGMDRRRTLCTMERYCDRTDTWEYVGRIPDGRSLFSGVTLWLNKDVYKYAPTSRERWTFRRLYQMHVLV